MKVIKEKFYSGMGRDVVWTFSIQILIMLCSFAINKLLANRLSIDDFGQYNVIKRSVQVLSFVMLAGVGIALPRYIPLYRNSTPPRRIAPLLTASMIYITGVSLVVFLICILFSAQMQDVVIGQGGNMNLLLVALAYAFILALAQYVFAYYRGISHFKWFNGSQLAMQLAIILPLVLLPVLTVSNVFTSWLIITILLVAFFFIKEVKSKWKEVREYIQPQNKSLTAHLSPLTGFLPVLSICLPAHLYQQHSGFTDDCLFLCRHFLRHDGHPHLLIHGYHLAALCFTVHRTSRDGGSQSTCQSFGTDLCRSIIVIHGIFLFIYQISYNSTLYQRLFGGN